MVNTAEGSNSIALVAQWQRRPTQTREVVGSSPSQGTASFIYGSKGFFVLKRIIAPLVLMLAIAGVTFAIAPVSPPPVSTTIAVAQMPPVELVSFSSCPLGQGCLYVDVNGGGSVQHVIFSQVHGCVNMIGALNDAMSSSIETIGSGWHFLFFDRANCVEGGSPFSPFIQPDDTSADWSAGRGVHNDLASSFELIR